MALRTRRRSTWRRTTSKGSAGMPMTIPRAPWMSNVGSTIWTRTWYQGPRRDPAARPPAAGRAAGGRRGLAGRGGRRGRDQPWRGQSSADSRGSWTGRCWQSHHEPPRHSACRRSLQSSQIMAPFCALLAGTPPGFPGSDPRSTGTSPERGGRGRRSPGVGVRIRGVPGRRRMESTSLRLTCS